MSTELGSAGVPDPAAPEDGFVALPGRDASASVRGFLYQAERTVLAWLELDEQTVLYCESGEDIDYVQLLPDATTATPVVLRLLEQVKLRHGAALTLRSDEAVEALANYLATREANPELRVLFRYFTNAPPGKEQGVAFPGDSGGIRAWEVVRAGADLAEAYAVVQALRDLFGSRTWPADSDGARVAAFLGQADDVVVRDLITPFEWATGGPPADELRPIAERRVLELGLARPPEQAEEIYRLLLMHALRTIASPGRKRLDRATLLEVVERGTVTPVDREFLHELRDLAHRNAEQLAVLAEQVAALRAQQADANQRITAVQDEFARVTRELIPGIPAVGTAARPRRDEPPLQPALYAPRGGVVAAVADRLRERTWAALHATAWMGKTQVARSVWAEDPGPRRWVALRAEPERLAAHLTDQLLLWHEEVTGNTGLAERYAQGQASYRDVAEALGSVAGTGALLVVDDVPDACPPDLSEALAAVGAAFRRAGHRVLSTSQVRLPRVVADALGADLAEVGVPPMDTADVRALLAVAGAPEAILTDRLAELVEAATGGHPVFVVATARAMAVADWLVDGEQIRGLLVGEPFRAERQQARQAVTQLTPDPEARDLLDRISIVRASFGYPMVTALAAVAPGIARPHERLNALVGRWVEALPGARYAITPLLQGTGDQVLPAHLAHTLHDAAAEVYLEQPVLDANDIWEAQRHLVAAENWLSLARFILGLGVGLRTAAEARALTWIPLLFRPGVAWPEEIPHTVRIVVRAVQARVLLLRHLPASSYEDDLEQLIAAAQPEDTPAVAVARFLTALPEAVPAAETARRAIEAARALRRLENELPDAIRLPPEQLFWAAGLRVRGTNDLAELVPVIRSLTPEERRTVFAAEPGYDGATFLVELAYLHEKAAGGPTDWDAVDSTLAELARLGQAEGAEPLRAAALRVRALLLADVRRRPDDALGLLEAHLPGASDETRFVLEGTRACVLLGHDRPEDAYAGFEAALALRGAGASPFLRNECLRRGAEAAVLTGRLERARALFLEALRAARATPARESLDPFVGAELLAELAWLHWQSGNRGRACRPLAAAVGRLMANTDPASVRFREALGRVRFLLNWLVPLATTGTAPQALPGERPYDVPFTGFTRRWNPDLSAFTEEQFQQPERLLPEVAHVSAALGHPILAAEALAARVRRARAAGDELTAGLMEWERAFVESHRGAVEDAVRAAVASTGGMAVMRVQANGGEETNGEAAWNALDAAAKATIERTVVLFPVVLGTFARLAAAVATREEAHALLDRLIAAINADGRDLPLRDRWLRLVERVRLAFSGAARRADVAALLRQPQPDGEDEQLVLTAVFAQCTDALPGEIAVAQSSVLFALAGLGVSAEPLKRDTARWILDTWRRMAAERGFALRSSAVLRDALARIPADTTFAPDAALVLLAATNACGVGLHASVHAALRDLAGA